MMGIRPVPLPGDMRALFEAYDKDGDGRIQWHELQQMFGRAAGARVEQQGSPSSQPQAAPSPAQPEPARVRFSEEPALVYPADDYDRHFDPDEGWQTPSDEDEEEPIQLPTEKRMDEPRSGEHGIAAAVASAEAAVAADEELAGLRQLLALRECELERLRQLLALQLAQEKAQHERADRLQRQLDFCTSELQRGSEGAPDNQPVQARDQAEAQLERERARRAAAEKRAGVYCMSASEAEQRAEQLADRVDQLEREGLPLVGRLEATVEWLRNELEAARGRGAEPLGPEFEAWYAPHRKMQSKIDELQLENEAKGKALKLATQQAKAMAQSAAMVQVKLVMKAVVRSAEISAVHTWHGRVSKAKQAEIQGQNSGRRAGLTLLISVVVRWVASLMRQCLVDWRLRAVRAQSEIKAVFAVSPNAELSLKLASAALELSATQARVASAAELASVTAAGLRELENRRSQELVAEHLQKLQSSALSNSPAASEPRGQIEPMFTGSRRLVYDSQSEDGQIVVENARIVITSMGNMFSSRVAEPAAGSRMANAGSGSMGGEGLSPREEGLWQVARRRSQCGVCGKPGKGVCRSCKRATYCCREHQMADWKNHKEQCKMFRARAHVNEPASNAGHDPCDAAFEAQYADQGVAEPLAEPDSPGLQPLPSYAEPDSPGLRFGTAPVTPQSFELIASHIRSYSSFDESVDPCDAAFEAQYREQEEESGDQASTLAGRE